MSNNKRLTRRKFGFRPKIFNNNFSCFGINSRKMSRNRQRESTPGFSTVELILAATLFVIFSTGVVGTTIQGIGLNRLGLEQAVATQFAAEGLDAVRSIRNRDFANLQAVNSAPRGVTLTGGVWTFTANNTTNTLTHSTTDNYVRTLKVESVNRDAAPPNGNIVTSGGTPDPTTKKISSTVTWNYTSTRPQNINMVTYLSDWENPITPTPAAVPTSTSTPTPVSPLPGWKYRKKITIIETKVIGSTNFSNFPVLISITDSNLTAHAQASGNDILFTSSNGTTKLNHEIERYTNSTGILVAWVNIPTLNATVNTDIYMYYGNPAAANQQNVTGTWNSNYKGVWHLKESPNGTAGQIKDSTVNANNGTGLGSMTSDNQVTGNIGGSLSFNGSSNYVQIPDDATLDMGAGQDFTVSAWVRSSQPNNDYVLLINKITGTTPRYGYSLTLHGDTFSPNWYGQQYYNETPTTAWGSSDVADGSWHYLSFKRAGTQLISYQDGSLSNTINASSLSLANSTPVRFARSSYGNPWDFYLLGYLDEIRISTTGRSTTWITTEYNNQSSPSTFHTVGVEQAY